MRLKQEVDNTSYVGYKAQTTARICMKQALEWGLLEDNTDCHNLFILRLHNTVRGTTSSTSCT